MTDPKKPGPKSIPTDAGIAELDADLNAAADMEEVDELVEGTTSERDEAATRAQACALELQKLLARHRCRIMPRLDPADFEPVGLAGDKLQIRATFFIAPLP